MPFCTKRVSSRCEGPVVVTRCESMAVWSTIIAFNGEMVSLFNCDNQSQGHSAASAPGGTADQKDAGAGGGALPGRLTTERGKPDPRAGVGGAAEGTSAPVGASPLQAGTEGTTSTSQQPNPPTHHHHHHHHQPSRPPIPDCFLCPLTLKVGGRDLRYRESARDRMMQSYASLLMKGVMMTPGQVAKFIPQFSAPCCLCCRYSGNPLSRRTESRTRRRQ